MNTADLTTVDPSTHVVALGIILLVAFACAFIFVGMALFSNVDSDDGGADIEEEDNIMFRS